ncbi:MAG: hypothetical protein RLZZ455_401 [Candidatus Parcubacteria bacterium]
MQLHYSYYHDKERMKIALNISAVSDDQKNLHKVRGIGTYTHELFASLCKYSKDFEIVGFTHENELPTDVDVVHYPYFDPYFFSLPLIKRKKTIVTVHDFIPLLYPEHFPAGTKGSLRWQIQKMLLKRVEGVISVSDATARDFVHFTGMKNKKVQTIYSAASETYADTLPDSELKVIEKKYHLPEKYLLYVGDVTWNKNLPRIVKAAKNTGMPLVLVGKAVIGEFDHSNVWNKDLEQVVMFTKNDPAFQLLGYVPQEDLAGIYRQASMLLFPSLYEGFGLPILEAMLSNCPVLTSDRGGIPEVAGDAALFVDPESIDAITGGIKIIVENRTFRQNLVRSGAARVKQFSWRKTAEQTLNFYEEICSK